MNKFYDRARMTTATSGSGTMTLGAAVTKYLTFANAGVSDGEQVSYVIEDGNDFEIGYGTYTASGTTLTRNLVKSSTGSLLSLTGAAEVFITATANDLRASRSQTESNVQTASYQLVATDEGKTVRMNVASANNLTVPPNSTVAFPVDTVINIEQYGAGQTTVVAGSGVTIRSRNGLKLAGQYAGGTIHKIATDEWMLFGDLST